MSTSGSKDDADLKLGCLQRQTKALGIPVIVVFEGWSAAGKGTLINELILPLDPRGFTVHSAGGPTQEEAFYPFLWRFWKLTPTRGRMAIFDRSWNRRVVNWPGRWGKSRGDNSARRSRTSAHLSGN